MACLLLIQLDTTYILRICDAGSFVVVLNKNTDCNGWEHAHWYLPCWNVLLILIAEVAYHYSLLLPYFLTLMLMKLSLNYNFLEDEVVSCSKQVDRAGSRHNYHLLMRQH
jgi:hypothetical protein